MESFHSSLAFPSTTNSNNNINNLSMRQLPHRHRNGTAVIRPAVIPPTSSGSTAVTNRKGVLKDLPSLPCFFFHHHTNKVQLLQRIKPRHTNIYSTASSVASRKPVESTHSLHNGCGAFFVFRGRAICVFLLFVDVASTTSFSSFYPLFLASLIVSRM